MGRARQMKRLKRALFQRARDERFTEDSSFPSWDQASDEKRAVIEQHDNFSGVRNTVRRLAQEQGHWAGVPIPLDGHQLVIGAKLSVR